MAIENPKSLSGAEDVSNALHALGRAYYCDLIGDFLDRDTVHVLGELGKASPFAVDPSQRDAWWAEIDILQRRLAPYRDRGAIFFEYNIPRMGRRIDALVLIDRILFVVEFKVGASDFSSAACDQVWDYALDLRNFHETSHRATIVPVLLSTNAGSQSLRLMRSNDPLTYEPVRTSEADLPQVIAEVLQQNPGAPLSPFNWSAGRYSPTPTIVEAAVALYGGHSVSEISRSDAGATNLVTTASAIDEIIASTRKSRTKSLVLVTGVPGSGKTLVGLDIATRHMSPTNDLYSVFLSGNGPLVAVLREALARDDVRRQSEAGVKKKLGEARSSVKAFIQNVHNFRDEGLIDPGPPVEHVALFDEAQRAWNAEQTSSFMRRKKGRPGFAQSEPEFLISCMDRHQDWAVVVCLIGGGQEINTGEAGMAEWIQAVRDSFREWNLYLSPNLRDSEYSVDRVLHSLPATASVHYRSELHLSVSMRSFRTEHVSSVVKAILDFDAVAAKDGLALIQGTYPIVLTRSLARAKQWLRSKSQGTERIGVVVSSQAERLKPHAIHVKAPLDPVHWFLDPKDDVRSSYYLEDAATEFHVQGLELDWTCVVWDADLRCQRDTWGHFSFVGSAWQKVRKPERQLFLKNAYRVLLTRARQGMVIVVPEGDQDDPTRHPALYNPTFDYLRELGLSSI
jgi:hypothetical protein